MNKDYIKGLGTGIILTSAIFFIGFLISPKDTVIQEKPYANVEENNKTNEINPLPQEEQKTEVKDEPKEEVNEKPKNETNKDIASETTSEETNTAKEESAEESSQTEENTADNSDKEVDSSTEEVNYIEVKVPEGYTSNGVGIILQEHGIIDDHKSFNLYCVRNKVDNNLRSGIYAFKPGTSFEEIVNLMVK